MLYPEAMGTAFNDLPKPLQDFHSVDGAHLYKGRVTVSHGNALARGIALAGGMPGKAGTMPFAFRMTRDGDAETWERDFDGHITRSTQWLKAPGVIEERVGTSTFLMEPRALDGRLHIPITKITGFGLPIPDALVVSCEGIEGVTSDGAITFDVHATIKGIGLIVRYRGEVARAT